MAEDEKYTPEEMAAFRWMHEWQKDAIRRLRHPKMLMDKGGNFLYDEKGLPRDHTPEEMAEFREKIQFIVDIRPPADAMVALMDDEEVGRLALTKAAMEAEAISKAAAQLGRKGGLVRGGKKAEAARKNLALAVGGGRPRHFNVLSLFDGIACGRLALDMAGIKVGYYYASEIDKPAMGIVRKQWPAIEHMGAVCAMSLLDSAFKARLEGRDGGPLVKGWLEGARLWELPRIDLLFAGFPCQGASSSNTKAADKKYMNDARTALIRPAVDIRDRLQPKYWLFENVVPKDWKKDGGDFLRQCQALTGVKPILINSDRWVPQSRERLYWTNIEIKIAEETPLWNIPVGLPERPDWKKYGFRFFQHKWITEEMKKKGITKMMAEKADGSCFTVTAKGRRHTVGKIEDTRLQLSPEISEVLQGIPPDYTAEDVDGKNVSTTNRIHGLGNGWTIPAIAWMLGHIRDVGRVKSDNPDPAFRALADALRRPGGAVWSEMMVAACLAKYLRPLMAAYVANPDPPPKKAKKANR